MAQAPYIYSWSPAVTLNNSSIANPIATPSVTTVYTLTVTDSSTPTACVDQDQMTVSIGASVLASAGADKTICTGSSATIGGAPSASCGNVPYVYSWLPTTGLSNPAAANPIATPTTTTQYILLVTDGLSQTKRDTMVVYVSGPMPTANGGLDQETCMAPTATVTATAPAVGTGTWSLVSGSGAIVNPNNLVTAVTGLTQGTTTVVRWTVTNGACSAFDDVTITTHANPSDADTGPDQNVCGSTATMAANTPTVGTGVWQIVTGTHHNKSQWPDYDGYGFVTEYSNASLENYQWHLSGQTGQCCANGRSGLDHTNPFNIGQPCLCRH